ncbi:MAG TPA: hypothetical protein PKD96_03560, partial [Candidatus Absconditabacterales bacterium]|nr:hypothetical protein [Candidatus Absconditabacterales bacterium]
MKLQNLYEKYQILRDQEPSSEEALVSLVDIENKIKEDLFELLELGERTGGMMRENSVLLEMYSAGGKERAFVERLLLGIETGENATIDDLLQDLIDATQRILAVENPEQIIKELNILHENAKGVILPPDYQPISTGNGIAEWREKKAPYNKFSLLINLLMKHGVYTDDLFSMTGDMREGMMREQSYIYLAIPRLDRTIFINNSYGEATYVYRGVLKKEESIVKGKKILRGDMNAKRVNFCVEEIGKWVSDMSSILFYERENPEIEQVIGEKKTKEELKEQFGLKLKSRKNLKTIEDWEKEFAKHPERQGKNTGWMYK